MDGITKKEGPLLDLLVEIAPDSSKTTLRSWIKEGRITVDGKVVKQGNAIVAKGQKITLGVKPPPVVEGGLRMIYEDRHLVAIEKPKGLLSVATDFEQSDTAHGLLKAHYHPRKVYVVHRLDQDTSGVMLFALSEEGYKGLKSLFEKHDIERSYCAIVEGAVEPPSGTWQSYLYEDNQYVVHSTEDPQKGTLAITHYNVVNVSSRFTRLELKLETGKKNQIRVHCSDYGNPIVGDKKYGSTCNPLHRVCLHAQLIAFIHPVTQKNMRFACSPPHIFDRLVKESHA